MKKIFFVIGLTALILTSCVSSVNNNRLNISITNVQKTEIFPLRSANVDLTLYSIGSHIMEQSGFSNGSGQSYGYYVVTVRNSQDKAPNFFICALVNGLTFFVPSLIGFPTDLETFDITANLYIFDSAGTIIKVYTKSDTFTKLAGLYYGQNPDKKASQYYSRLFKSLIEQANNQSGEINYFLRESGPVTNENLQSARAKIADYFKSSRY